ncbi:MAG: phosphoglycolate phosphatase [Pseudomonadota bacterium]|nr:MAG: phosphoglycolate phosphatase [Pseudomonadota bacterium]
MTPKAILFDLDGTLVDSVRDLTDVLNIFLAEEGLPQVSLEKVKSMIGDGAAKLVERALVATGGDLGRLSAHVGRFLAIYEAGASRHTVPYPGVREALEELSRRGLKLAVVTNKPYAATMDILAALDLTGFFGAVVGGDSLPERKPHPAPLLAALSQLAVPPEAAIMVGDNYHDVEAAHAAGVRAFAVTYGYSHRPHHELGAERLLDNMAELPALIDVAVSA